MTKSRVLIVDDEAENLNSLRRLLRPHFEVYTANTAAEALELVRKQPPFEVIVSDQNMPVLKGSELFERVQLLTPHSTRILVTGYADLRAMIDAVNAGHIWRYIAKPWEPDDFIQTLQQAAERARLSKALEKSKRDLEKALGELRAKDGAREKLIAVLRQEFRILPQIVESLRAVNTGPAPEDELLRAQFLENLRKRIALMTANVDLLIEDEKRFAALDRQPVSLLAGLEELKLKRGVGFTSQLEPGDAGLVISDGPLVKGALEHFLKVVSGNSGSARPAVTLETLGGRYFVIYRIETPTPPLVPKGLEQASVHVEKTWSALLEPFVGLENSQDHETNLRVETSRWVRFLNSQGFRAEFQISKEGAAVELLIAFRAATEPL